MGAAASASSKLGDISSEAIEDYCSEITGKDYTETFSKHNVNGQVLEKYVGNVDALLEFLVEIGMEDVDHQQMLYDMLMQVGVSGRTTCPFYDTPDYKLHVHTDGLFS